MDTRRHSPAIPGGASSTIDRDTSNRPDDVNRHPNRQETMPWISMMGEMKRTSRFPQFRGSDDRRTSSSPHRFLHLRMPCGVDVTVKVPNGAFACSTVTHFCLPAAQPQLHDVTHHRSLCLVEVCGEIIHLRPGRGVQTGIHTTIPPQLPGSRCPINTRVA